ncbi:hypothetical protein AB0G15_24825 [Streptosporangium sp. NPDC023825]|uniref:hypothetical protein n=1 Tax=Streptosporangium sp. NPDC023825 TaxID=3154909 RepID=UPI0034345143
MTRSLAGTIGRSLVPVLACLVGCTATPRAGWPAAEAPRVTASPARSGHGPLSGQPLGPGSGIRLLVGGDGQTGLAPAVLDVDTGASTPVSGLPDPDPRLTLSAFVHGRHTVIAVSGPAVDQGRLYLLEGGEARKLATGWNAFPAFDDSGFWITDRPARDGPCTVRKQAEDGRTLHRPRWSHCGALPFLDTPYGLHARHGDESILLAHDSLRKTGRHPGIVAATSRELLVRRRDENFALVIPGTGKERPIGRPAGAGEVRDGEVSPDGRYIAVPFLAPTTGPHERLDVWVLDTKTLRWAHLPSTPVPVDVKTRRMRWTPNGRLVLAGAFVTTADAYPRESDHASMIATWRPGEQALSVRRLPVEWQTNLEIVVS